MVLSTHITYKLLCLGHKGAKSVQPVNFPAKISAITNSSGDLSWFMGNALPFTHPHLVLATADPPTSPSDNYSRL